MNRPSRDDDGLPHTGSNQSPPSLSADLTTRQDLIGTVNARSYHDHKPDDIPDPTNDRPINTTPSPPSFPCPDKTRISKALHGLQSRLSSKVSSARSHVSSTTRRVIKTMRSSNTVPTSQVTSPAPPPPPSSPTRTQNAIRVLVKYAKHIGPGAMVSVAYIDPGNYATDIAAGVSYRFKLLFVVLLSNLIAIFLQSLCIRIGCVTGKNLAQMCKLHFPRWLNLFVYVFAEGAIIATDIAEVIGTAIALNLLFHIPLVAGCAISILDVLVILLVYKPGGSIRTLRAFELFVLLLVFGVVICFCFQLSLIENTGVGEVFKGYLPSSAVVQSQGLYQSIGILGATVMPHSLYLGTGVVQPRLFDLDRKARAEEALNSPSNATLATADSESDSGNDLYNSTRPPLLSSIRSCISYSTAELAISLFTFALFVNSAILIIAGAELYAGENNDSDASLFAIHDLLSSQVSKAAGVVFALALLLSGTSAGIVCTISGQIVSEGHLRWDWVSKPWVRRLITRSIAITPSIVIAGAVGSSGLTTALEASQVALSIILPVVSGPVIWFTCFGLYMVVKAPIDSPDATTGSGSLANLANEPNSRSSCGGPGNKLDEKHVGQGMTKRRSASEANVTSTVQGGDVSQHEPVEEPPKDTNMRNPWYVTVLALAIWCLVVIMNVAALVFLGKGEGA